MRAILHHRFILNNAHARRLGSLRTTVLADSNLKKLLRKTTVLTFACDAMFLAISLGVVLLFRALLIALWPTSGSMVERTAVLGLVAFAVIGEWVWFLGLDAIRRSRPARVRYLPFSYARAIARHIYTRRLEISLWTLAISCVLLLLCVLAVETSLFSKLFLTSIVALVIFAIRKSVPITRISVGIAAGAFVTAVLTIVLAGVVIL